MSNQLYSRHYNTVVTIKCKYCGENNLWPWLAWINKLRHWKCDSFLNTLLACNANKYLITFSSVGGLTILMKKILEEHPRLTFGQTSMVNEEQVQPETDFLLNKLKYSRNLIDKYIIQAFRCTIRESYTSFSLVRLNLHIMAYGPWTPARTTQCIEA